MPEEKLVADYDEAADVMYIYINCPVAAFIEEEGEYNILRRISFEDNRPCGMTIVEFTGWSAKKDLLLDQIADFLSVDREAARLELARATA